MIKFITNIFNRKKKTPQRFIKPSTHSIQIYFSPQDVLLFSDKNNSEYLRVLAQIKLYCELIYHRYPNSVKQTIIHESLCIVLNAAFEDGKVLTNLDLEMLSRDLHWICGEIWK